MRVLQQCIAWLKDLLASYVPYFLYDEMAVEVLAAVKELIEATKKTYQPNLPVSSFLAKMNVVVNMTEVVLTQHLRKIKFSRWTKIMRYVLYKNLCKLKGLEVLDLGSCTVGWNLCEYDKYIHEGVMSMKNLRSLCLCFDCTDSIVQILGDTCVNLQCLDVTSSRTVTDRSINSLLNCSKLREVHLNRTSVSIIGYTQLFIGLAKLEKIGRCDELGTIVNYIHVHFPEAGPFGLKHVQTRDITTENLRLLVVKFPQIENISLFHDEHLSDLTILVSLEKLKHLELLSCGFYADSVLHLLELRGANIVTLRLEHVVEIDLHAMSCIGQFCPNLVKFVVYNCDFMNQRLVLQIPTANINAKKSFQKLERLHWMVDSAVAHLEYVLVNAVNVRDIELGSSTGITHTTVENVLMKNPMKELEEFNVPYNVDMGMNTVKMLLESCPKLKRMVDLQHWQEISDDELKAFKQFIKENNFDLDLMPKSPNDYNC